MAKNDLSSTTSDQRFSAGFVYFKYIYPLLDAQSLDDTVGLGFLPFVVHHSQGEET